MDLKPLLKSNPQDWEINYRLYKPSDSEKCIQLEQESSQVPRLGGLLHVGTIFNGEYDSKCKSFPDHVIAVAEAIHKQGVSVICGAVCLGIKDIYFNGEKTRSGVLFDLRVSEKFQKRGIATKLMNLLDETARSKGCEFSYLSVNDGNKKAIALYNKLGYNFISERTLRGLSIPKAALEERNNTKTINSEEGKDLKLVFNRIDKHKALEMTSKQYYNQDLGLVNLDEVFDSPQYLGTYTVSTEDQKNVVGLTLVKFNTQSFFGLKRFIFDSYLYSNEWVYSVGLGFWLFLTFAITRFFTEKLYNGNTTDSLLTQHCVTTGIFFILACLVIFVYNKLHTLVLTMSGFKLRGRYIGAFMQAENQEMLPQMVQFLLEKLEKESSDNHISSITYNGDSNDKFLKLWNKKVLFKGKTFFMGRYIGKDPLTNKSLEGRVPSEYMFFDPRDL